MSSRIIYDASLFHPSMLNNPLKYICFPRDRAHSVLPYREGPMRRRDLGLSRGGNQLVMVDRQDPGYIINLHVPFIIRNSSVTHSLRDVGISNVVKVGT